MYDWAVSEQEVQKACPLSQSPDAPLPASSTFEGRER